MKKRFSAWGELEPPQRLYGGILLRIARARRRGARIRALALTACALMWGLLLLPVLQYAGREFYTSGFYDLASLLISDRTAVLSSWREFGFSLLESLPSLAVLLVCALFAALCWSLYRAVRDARAAFSPLSSHA